MDLENKYGVIKALEELRQKFNLTKTDVAEMTGLSARTLFDILKGQRSLTKNTSDRITENLATIFVDWGEALYRKNEKLNGLGVLVMTLKKYAEKGVDGFVHRHRKDICSCPSSKKQVLTGTKRQKGQVTQRSIKCLECNAKYNSFEMEAEDYFRFLIEHETLNNILTQFENADIPYQYCLKTKTDKPARERTQTTQINQRPFSMKMGKQSF
jgi:transcriptional regulator with XRE-family HTH domain